MTVTWVVRIGRLGGVWKKSVGGRDQWSVWAGRHGTTRLHGASYFFGRRKELAYEAEGGSDGGREVEGVQGAGRVGGTLFHDDGGGAGDEGVTSVWAGGEV